jgi:hypothetical protein
MPARYPRFVSHELACKVRYPHRLTTAAGELRYRRSRWEHMNEGDDAPAIRHRESVFWLHDGRERIAMLEFSEYDLEPAVYWDEFWRWADGLEEQAGVIVEAMRETFGGAFASVADFGSIVFAKHAWVAPPRRTRVDIRAAFNGSLQALAPTHAAVFLLAYPQSEEQEEATTETVEDLGDWDWRQRALIRLYERELGFRLLENREAPFGVMWRPRGDIARFLVNPANSAAENQN